MSIRRYSPQVQKEVQMSGLVTDDTYEEDAEEYVEGEEELDEDPEILEMKKRVAEMESEHEKLNLMQKQVEKQIHTASDNLDEASMYVHYYYELVSFHVFIIRLLLYIEVMSVKLIMRPLLKS